MSATLLLEVGTEELPPGEIDAAVAALSAGVTRHLGAARLSHGSVETFATPRRLAVRIAGVAAQAETVEETVTGPAAKVAFDAVGQPTKAAIGFAAGKGVGPDALLRVVTPRGEYVAVRLRREGEAVQAVVARAFVAALTEIPWKRSMRWGWEAETFGRPVHWIVALYGAEVVPLRFGAVASGRTTFGHRFMAPGAIDLISADVYPDALRAAFVVADVEERKRAILDGAEAAAHRVGFTVVHDPELADEVKHLVEWPVPLAGRFPEELLEVPREVLVTSMRSHQRYFAAEDASGALANVFIFVSNVVVPDPDVIVRGNLRVLLARLEDAKFFYREDRKHTLEERGQKLASVRYIDGLGTLADRTTRVVSIVDWLCARVCPGDAQVRADALRAAALCKADLTTGMVYEFPVLQGIMGRYYALLSGERGAVAEAISEHYAPRGASDAPARTPAGIVVAIAEKLDVIAGCLALGLVPTGSADPYALRRAALGVVRTCLERGVSLSLSDAFSFAVALQPTRCVSEDIIVQDAVEFVEARLRALLAADVPADIADAVVAVVGDDLPSAPVRARVLDRMRRDADFGPLAAGYKRTVNIVRRAEQEGWTRGASVVEGALLADDAERALAHALDDARRRVSVEASGGDFEEVAAALIRLKGPIDEFFEEVMVNTGDERVRQNRLALLDEVRTLFGALADLSRVQVDGR